MTDHSPARINADRLEAAVEAIPLVEIAKVQPIGLAKKLFALRSAAEITAAQLRAQKESS